MRACAHARAAWMSPSEPVPARLAIEAVSIAARVSTTARSASETRSSARRRSATRFEAVWSLRARLRIATWASAVARRVTTSSSRSRINSSPANTLSFGLTKSSPMAPMAAAVILISPDQGSTRPGATACQRLGSSVPPRSCATSDGARRHAPRRNRPVAVGIKIFVCIVILTVNLAATFTFASERAWS